MKRTEEQKIERPERFEDCGFMKVKVSKSLLVRNKSTILWKITIFTLHKLLLFAALVAMVAQDIKGAISIESKWSNAAVASGYPVIASSE